jgi:hypothetical protein
MARRHIYLLLAFLSGAAFVVLAVAANNFYLGASQTLGGNYYLFDRAVPRTAGALLWAAIKPLLLTTPVFAALATYLAVKSRRNPRAPGVAPGVATTSAPRRGSARSAGPPAAEGNTSSGLPLPSRCPSQMPR